MKAFYYEPMVNDHYDSEEHAISEFIGIVDCDYMLDEEPIEQDLAYLTHIAEHKGYDLYYCYGADHYCIGVDEYPES